MQMSDKTNTIGSGRNSNVWNT